MKAHFILVTAAALAACGQSKPEGATSAGASASSPSAAATSSGSAAAASPEGALAIAATAKDPIVLSEVGGGVCIIDEPAKHAACTNEAGDLEVREVPSGLPAEMVRSVRVQGRLPDTLWLTVELKPEEKKKRGKTPFLRWSKAGLKSIADDWEPLVVPWSDNRVLAMSTSSGDLKIKLLQPFTKTPPQDQPARWVPDETCAKSLKLAEAIALPNGDVLAAGRCEMGSDKRGSYVVARWSKAGPAPSPAPDAPKPAPTAGPAPSASASAAAEPAPKDDEEAKKGTPMSLQVVTIDKLRHRAIAFVSNDEIYLAAASDSDSRVYRLEPTSATPLDLPKLDGPLLDIAVTASGDLWILTGRAAAHRRRGEAWASVPAPEGTRFERVEAVGETVFISGQTEKKSGVVYRAGRGKAPPALAWDAP